MTDKVIVGAMMVSRNAELLDITIPNMLKWCDWCLILMDNESEEVANKVLEYQKKNYYKIIVRRSSMPSNYPDRKGRILSYRRRCKGIKGMIRDDVFVALRRILDEKRSNYDKIDILLWPDSDEIFTDYLPELLEKFWSSKYKAISMKPIDVVHNMKTIKDWSMGSHVHILKYSRDLGAIPWRFWAMYHPLVAGEVMKARYYSVHLAYLTENIRKWRSENWKKDKSEISNLWKLEKSIEHLSPKEISDTFKREPDLKFT